jgi:hypothetical protein
VKTFPEIAPQEIQLCAALAANVSMRVEAERLIAAYVEPNSDLPAVINELITFFDGPRQREAQRLAIGAMGSAPTSRPSQGGVNPPGVADLRSVPALSDDRVPLKTWRRQDQLEVSQL